MDAQPDAKRQRVLKRIASGDADLMQKASSRCCSAEAIRNGSLLRLLADENVASFQKLSLGSSQPSEPSATHGSALAFGPVANRQENDLKLTWASCCSGSEGPAYAIQAINDVCRARGLKVRFEHTFSCESNKDKRKWIAQVLDGLGPSFDRGCIFEDITELWEGTSKCLIHDQKCDVKGVGLLVIGTSCKDLSRLNSSRSTATAVLQQETSKGGSAQTFQGFLKYVEAYRPVFTLRLGMVKAWLSTGPLLSHES